MLILKLTSPAGEVRYVTGAFPSACGKTNLAMLVPTMPGWKVETIGDDICWMKIGPDGMLAGDQSGGRFLRRRAGHEHGDEPERRAHARRQLHLHQHRAHRRRRRLVGGSHRRARRRTAPTGGARTGRPRRRHARSAPELALHRPGEPGPGDRHASGRTPTACPISAILFGGRRASVVPLVHEAFDWAHGVFLGSIMASETTAAATGAVGNLRRDPFAMLPFCGYNMADYWAHWLSFRDRMDEAKLPRIFYVNWFRKAADGRFLWPGFGENSRVLEWVFERCAGRGEAVETPIGYVPAPGAIDTEGLEVSSEDMDELLRVDREEWRAEVPVIGEYFAQFGDRLPAGHLRPARGSA